MTAWHIEATRNAIKCVHGSEQLELARPCLRSLYDRQFYARFHYQRAQDKDFFPIAFAIDEPAWDRFNVEIRKIAADISACVQSLHSLPDILASAIYYSLALDKTIKPAKGRYVNHAFVTESIANISDLGAIHSGLIGATTGSHYKHLAALANQSKHYSIVFPALNADLTGDRPEQYMLVSPAFVSRGVPFPEVLISEFMPVAYEQLTNAVLETGHALDAHLQTMISQAGSK